MLKKNTNKLFLLLFLFALSIPVKANEFNKFTEILNDHNMIFSMPKDFTQTAVKKNDDVSYQFAIKSKKSKLEIRYAVFSLKERLREYEEWKNSKNKNGVTTDPNQGYEIFTSAVVENISGGENYKETVFDKKSVKNDFNADWGASYFTEGKSGFTKGYKYALIAALHKDNIADAYIVYLFDDFKTVQNEIQEVFISMKFKSDYFNKKSILFSTGYMISNVTKVKTSPQDIEKKVNYNDSDNLNIDDYLAKIAKAYSLKLKKVDFKDMQNVVNLVNDGNLIIIIYGNKKINHSAVVKGYKVVKETLVFRVYDSGLQAEDSIVASTLVSSYWNLKFDRAYYFSK